MSSNSDYNDTPSPASDAQTGDPRDAISDRRYEAETDAAVAVDPTFQADGRLRNDLAELEERLRAKEEEVVKLHGRHQRAVQEFEETKTRLRREVTQEVDRQRRGVISELLEVLDNLDRAIDAARRDPDVATLTRGVELARDQMLAKLKGFGVERAVTLGQPFDPARHEAVTVVSTRDPAQDGHVADEIRPCYMMGDSVLRPAMVTVAQAHKSS